MNPAGRVRGRDNIRRKISQGDGDRKPFLSWGAPVRLCYRWAATFRLGDQVTAFIGLRSFPPASDKRLMIRLAGR